LLQKIKPLLLIAVIIIVVFAVYTQRNKPAVPEQLFSETTFSFGTLVDVSFYGADTELAKNAYNSLLTDFNYMHNTWHAWQFNALARVNGLLQTGSKFTLAPSILPLIRNAKTLSIKSEGLFNPAIGGLVNQWGFHSDAPDDFRDPPSQEAIQSFLKDLPTMQDIHTEGIKMWGSNENIRLDFGGYAKGYAIDVAIQNIRDLGIENAIINAGGDLRAIGKHGERPWHIGIRDPRGEGVFASLDIEGDESVFTSGDYERFFESEGHRYHHLIDPRSGYPADKTTSVTVIHTDAATADAAATALFIAGPDEWYRIANKMGIKYVMLIDKSGTVHMNPAMAKRIKFQLPKPPKVIISEKLP